jgi:hypothetical protein
MRLPKFVCVTLLMAAATLSATKQAHAEQRRDWMVAAQPSGTYANIDVIFPGAQFQLEHRVPFYGVANELNIKANVLPTIVFMESQLDADLRLVVLSLGGSVGFRDVFHNITFGPNDTNFDRVARRSIDLGGSYTNQFSTFGEGRATLSLPLNDYMVFQSINALRFEGGPDRTFDWRLGIVRDAGMQVRSDTVLFFKHRNWGALGPQVQVLNYPLAGVRNTQVNYGFTFTTRPGLRARNDIFFLSVLFGIGGTVNGVPTQDVYGNHLFKMPVTFQLAYRTVFEIAGPKRPGQSDDD